MGYDVQSCASVMHPRREGSVSLMMQSLGRRYVRYFNHQYQRSGTLWEGRYKSCLIQEECYLLEVYRYMELNPVRAEMVAAPRRLSLVKLSSQCFGVQIRPLHPTFGLPCFGGVDTVERRKNYRTLFKRHVEGEVLTEIRANTNKGLALGNDRFKEEIETLTGRRVKAKKRGRPVGWRKID